MGVGVGGEGGGSGVFGEERKGEERRGLCVFVIFVCVLFVAPYYYFTILFT